MGDRTGIEWTDATWNPVTGCTKVSQGCKHCYAERVFPRAYGKEKVFTAPEGHLGLTTRPRRFTDVQCHPERLDQPLHWKKPRRIFVNSMSDLFHEALPDEFIDDVWVRMLMADRHTYQILTKRPERMPAYFIWASPLRRRLAKKLQAMGAPGIAEGIEKGWRSPLPKHIHLGISAEDQETYDERWRYLRDTPAAVRFVSYEPALGPLDLGKRLLKPDWVICGGESGPGARPMHPDWVRSIRDQCVAAGVPFFFKQWGEYAPIRGIRFGVRSGLLDIKGQFPPLEALEEIKAGNFANLGNRVLVGRVGKKAAGASLDGREWKEFPAMKGEA